MKTAVIGTRTYSDYGQLCEILNNLSNKPTEIISGGANGADALAERYAKDNNLPLTVINADWAKHGKAAGPIRNIEIVKACEQVVAMWDGESKGTKHTIDTARKTGKPTKVVNYASATVAQAQQTSLWGWRSQTP